MPNLLTHRGREPRHGASPRNHLRDGEQGLVLSNASLRLLVAKSYSVSRFQR